jgi:hypothetical protein
MEVSMGYFKSFSPYSEEKKYIKRANLYNRKARNRIFEVYHSQAAFPNEDEGERGRKKALLIGLMRISWYSNNKSTASIKN